MDPDRKARLAAMRAEAAAAGAAADGDAAAAPAAEQQQADVQQQEAGEPVLRFRNYAPVADERIQHEKVRTRCCCCPGLRHGCSLRLPACPPAAMLQYATRTLCCRRWTCPAM